MSSVKSQECKKFRPYKYYNQPNGRRIATGYSNSGVRKCLPPSFKHIEMVRVQASPNHQITVKSSANITITNPANYQSQDLESYPRLFLIQIIRYLKQKQVVKQVVHEVKAVATTNKNYYSPIVMSVKGIQEQLNTLLEENSNSSREVVS